MKPRMVARSGACLGILALAFAAPGVARADDGSVSEVQFKLPNRAALDQIDVRRL